MLCTEAFGFQLCVRASGQAGNFRFTLRNTSDHPGHPASVLMAGEYPSAMRAMAEAEQAALALSREQPWPRGKGVPERPVRDLVAGGFAVHRRVTWRDRPALSDA
jgi:hypothetical protein